MQWRGEIVLYTPVKHNLPMQIFPNNPKELSRYCRLHLHICAPPTNSKKKEKWTQKAICSMFRWKLPLTSPEEKSEGKKQRPDSMRKNEKIPDFSTWCLTRRRPGLYMDIHYEHWFQNGIYIQGC